MRPHQRRSLALLRARMFCSRIGSIPSHLSVRVLFNRCGLLLLPLALCIAAGPAVAAPATEAEMSLYTRIAALNVCIARTAGVDFDKAVVVAGETIAQVIQGQNGGAIAKVGSKALPLDALRQGSINSAVLAAVQICPDEVPADVRAKVDAVLQGVKGDAGTAPPTAPGRAPAVPAARPTNPAPKPQATPAAPATKPATSATPAAKP